MSLDSSVGGENSNSYVSLSEATNYFQDRTHIKDWEDFIGKEQALVTASLQLDWYITWKGFKASESQALDWPRSGVLDKNLFEVSDSIIPNQLKQAVFELALSSIKSDRMADNPMSGLSQLKAGSLMIKAEQLGFISTAKEAIPEKIRKILSGLTANSGIGVVRLMRA